MTYLELLSPARNLECGIAAIDHGADAVYIGAPRFGARATAGNSLGDIRQLCIYAHRFAAKVFVTVNTIVYDHELDDMKILLGQLREIGVDAIIVQDLAVADMARGMGLHASTQTDNRTAEKVKWLRECGFSRAVLARELSIDEISKIHNSVPDMPLEAFVHGALCVGYSGLCYASQYCFHRSANRGECAQFCRLAFDLVDVKGKVLEQNRHLLSLKDLCQLEHLGELIDAGVTSFKIEGRLKDVNYVKNVTAAYSQRLDEFISSHSDKYRRASLGRCSYTFKPNLNKTFNRGYTTYFLKGRKPDIFSPDTPKAIGEYVGRVKSITRDSIVVSGVCAFANGDGMCFFNDNRQLEGFRVNKVIGNRLFPQKMPSVRQGMSLYRNSDNNFDRLLSKNSAERRIGIKLELETITNGYQLSATVPGVVSVTTMIDYEHQEAQTPQQDNICNQLCKLGTTVYECINFSIPSGFSYFIPSSLLSKMRREVVDALDLAISEKRLVEEVSANGISTESGKMPIDTVVCHRQTNIANSHSRALYSSMGHLKTPPAFELEQDTDFVLMQCRHCLRYSLGHCVRNGGTPPEWQEPLFLALPDGRRFKLHFDCNRCQMNIIPEK